MSTQKVQLSLVGSGPGDPELITLKAIKALQQADLVLYDPAVNTALLQFVSPNGKAVGMQNYMGHLDIADLLDLNAQYRKGLNRIVLLLPGDPLEHCDSLEKLMIASSNGFAIEVVSGVSQAIGLPTAAGLPVTRRGTNESFWVIAGPTTTNGELPKDIFLAARSRATIIITNVGLRLEAITAIFKEARSNDEPAVLLQSLNGRQKMLGGTLETIGHLSRKVVSSQALLMIGKVAHENQALRSMQKTNYRRAS
ncbi:MAG: uroporphyrinogen-III C-methyltransferase [Bacteroidota bacterium]